MENHCLLCIKQRCLGREVNTKDLQVLKTNWNDHFVQFEAHCFNEVQKLKDSIFYENNFSLFKFLTYTAKKASRFVRSPEAQKSLEATQFVEQYPIYGKDLNERAAEILVELKKQEDEKKNKEQNDVPIGINPISNQVISPVVPEEPDFNQLLLSKGPRKLLLYSVWNGNIGHLQRLLERGIDVNTPDEYQRTPLHHAVSHKQKDTVTFLLQRGANVNAGDCESKTPLYPAIDKQYLEIMEILLDHKADPNVSSKQGKTPLQIAIESNHVGSVDLLLRYGAQNFEQITPLCFAVKKKSFEIVHTILKHGHSPNHSYGPRPLNIALMKKDKRIVRLLLEYGADPNFENSDSPFPLYIVQGSDLETITMMVESGVEIDHQDSYGVTVLHYAAEQNNLEVVTYLLACGANVNLSTRHEMLPLHYAIFDDYDKVAELLVKGGTNLDFRSDGQPFLHYAIRHGSEKCVDTFLSAGFDLNEKNDSGELPLNMATVASNSTIVKSLSLNLVKNYCVGFSVSAENLQLLSKVMTPELEDFKMKCDVEVEKLKEPILANYVVSLHKILIENVDQVMVYFRNEEMNSAVLSRDIGSEFPIYGEILMQKIAELNRKVNVSVETNKWLSCIFNNVSNLPPECIDHISHYFKDADKEQFVDEFNRKKSRLN